MGEFFDALLSREQELSVPIQYIQKQHAEYPAGNDFANPYGDKGKPEGLHSISIEQNEGNDDCIGSDGGNRCEPLVFPKQVGSDCTYEACQGSENNIRNGTACDDIGNQTSQGDTGNGSRGEER